MKSQDRKLEFELDTLTAQLPNACSLTIQQFDSTQRLHDTHNSTFQLIRFNISILTPQYFNATQASLITCGYHLS
jgi:hypothetical protein